MKSLFAAALVVFTIQVAFPQRDIASLPGITKIQAIGNKVFFTAKHDTYGTELFISDGKIGSFKLLKDINPGYPGSNPGEFMVLNNQLFFTASSDEHGLSVWKSDGTTEGTKVVYSVANADPWNLTVFKDRLYFTTNIGKIIRTDGTAAGTEVFFDSGDSYGRMTILCRSEDFIYFTADNRTIYRDNGTSRIDFLGPLSWEDVYFRNLFAVGNKLVAIKAATYDYKIRIYSIDIELLDDGEDHEWQLIGKLDAPTYGSQWIGNFTTVSGKLFFSFQTDYDNVEDSDQLWVCDGSEAGTKLVKSFGWQRHMSNSEMDMFFAFKGKLFFRSGSLAKHALWTSDGTDAGTVKVHDVVITPPAYDERPPLLVADDKFYFSGGDGYFSALWSSDGTPEGTERVMRFSGEGLYTPHDFSLSSDVLYFVTNQDASTTLWSTMPAPDITVSLSGGSGTIINSGSKPYLFYGVTKGACQMVDLFIINKGLEELYISDVFITGSDFYLVKRSLPETLAPGDSATIQLVFNPVSEETAKATLSILSNDNNEAKYIILLEATPSKTGTKKICEFPKDAYVKSLRSGVVSQPVELSNYAIEEGKPKGSVIGTFSRPANATFELAGGEGDADNEHFIIEGNLLKSNAVFNFNNKNLYSVRVRANSSEGRVEASLRIKVANASTGSEDATCQLAFEQMSFSYTDIEANEMGHLFTTSSQGDILRSMDAGLHWEVVHSGNRQSLSGIVFKGNTGYAQGSSNLFKSEDGGDTWFKLYVPLTGSYYSYNFGVFFFNEKEGYVGTEKAELFYTNDGGKTWERRANGGWDGFRDLSFLTKDKGYATSAYGDLLKTIDGGRTWTGIDLTGSGWTTRVSDIMFLDDRNGYIVGQSKLYTTSDGGQTWTQQPGLSDEYTDKVKFFSKDLGFIYGGNGLIYKTLNGGASWEMLVPGLPGGMIVGITQSAGKLFAVGRNHYYGNEARSLGVSSDQGLTWSLLSMLTDESMYSIRFSSKEKGHVLGQNTIFKTEDSGLTWRHVETELVNVVDVYAVDDNKLIMVSEGHIYKSTDGGKTAQRVLTTPQSEVYLPAGKFYSFPGDLLFSVSWQAVYRSDDKGETWTLVPTDPGDYITGISFVSSAVGYRIDLFGSVEKSIDGGKNWTEIYTRDPYVSSGAFQALYFLDENLGYKGGEFLHRTTDGGVTWKKVQWPLREIIGIRFETEAHGYVVTRNGEVHETSDEGATWQWIYSSSTQLSDVEFGAGEIYMTGERGFVARMNTAPRTPPLPGYIYGPDRVCVGDAAEFFVAVNYDTRTQWSTTAGNVEDHNGYVTVNFPTPGEYTITAKHYNLCGTSDLRTRTVQVSGPPNAPVIDGPNPVAKGELDVEYTIIDGSDDSNYLWDVVGSAEILPVENGIVIDWALTTEEASIKVLEVDAFGCRAYGTLAVPLDEPLAIESELYNHVSVYPNPAEADTNVTSSHDGLVYVRIVDALGREYSRTVLSGNEEQIMKTRQLPAGLYFVEISDGVRSVTRKLIRK